MALLKNDLQALPDQLHEAILALLFCAEQTGEWPSQALHGAIHSLAKCDDAETVGQFRPVTILPLIYQCWSTIRSRVQGILKHIEATALPT